ncbi:hypothetical protein Tco_0495931 [Tanacetum coccineum]
MPIQGRGHGKGYMRKGGPKINIGSKKPKVEILRKRRTIIVKYNIVEDPDQAVELAISVNAEEQRKRRENLMATETHASLVFGKEVDKEVEEGFNAQMKLKLKAVKTIPPAVQSLLDLKQGSKACRQETDQTGRYGVHIHDKEQQQPTFKPLSPMNTDTQTTFVIHILEGNPKVHAEVLADHFIHLHQQLHHIIQQKILNKSVQNSSLQSLSYNSHDDHLTSNNALMNPMEVDEMQARGEPTQPILEKHKAPIESSNYETYADAEEPQQEQEVPTKEFGGKNSHWFKQQKKKDRIDDDEAPASSKYSRRKSLLKRILKELDMNWAKAEGNTFHTELTKPLPLEGPPGRKTIPTSYFFNRDLKYLMDGNKEKKYAILLSKYYASKYEGKGIDEIIPNL